ncbi:MAG TPA: ABC transporter permease [Streptosporangiaceae bacterium]|nr:ABC transporter permease [Streptosporangiaceae bacterium]
MSTASAVGATKPQPGWHPAPVRHWLRLFGSELRNVFLRPRNLAMLAVIAAAPVFLGIVMWINTPAPGSGGPGAGVFVGQIAENGVFLSLFAIYVLLTVLLPLSVSVVAGDSVAGEAGIGTLRTLLTVPAGRTRLLVTKYVMIVVFCLTATVLVAGLGLLMGAIFFPVGPVTLLSGTTVSLSAGLARLALIVLYVAAALSALGAVGLALSTFTQHAIAVMATILVFVIVSEILDAVTQVAVIHPYLPTHFWFSFDALLRTPIAWSQVLHGLGSFAAYTVIFGAVAWTRMRRANITC